MDFLVFSSTFSFLYGFGDLFNLKHCIWTLVVLGKGKYFCLGYWVIDEVDEAVNKILVKRALFSCCHAFLPLSAEAHGHLKDLVRCCSS